MVRPRLRQIPAQMSGRYFMAWPLTLRLGDGLAILARVGSAVVDAGAEVPHHGLATAHDFRVIAAQIYLMSAAGERLADVLRNAILHHDVATVESHFGEARRLHRRLDVHPVVDHVGDELRVRLRLVVAAHDSEGDALIAFLHERRNDRVQRAFVPGECVRRGRIEVEERPTILQHEPRMARHQA